MGGELAGYVISFPYIMGKPYPINEIYVALDGDCMLHDLCVAKWARGSGLGASMADAVLRGPRTGCFDGYLRIGRFLGRLRVQTSF